MATALGFPRDLFLEMYLGDTSRWQNIITDVRQTISDPIKITRGRSSEQGDPAPGNLTCKLNNFSGNYNPSDPMGQWFGIISKGVPVRFGINGSSDTFSRTVSNSWGDADTGETWDNNGVGGAVLASDWNVGSGVGTHSVPATLAFRRSVIPVNLADVEVSCTTTSTITDITGGTIEPCNILLRWIDSNNYYMIRVSIDTAELVSISIFSVVSGVATEIAGPIAVVGVGLATKNIRVKAQAEGETIRAKVWSLNVNANEPLAWNVEVHDNSLSAAGSIGVRNGVGSGNTNAKPIIFSNDNFQVRHLRFSGEISELKPRWSLDHKDKWAELRVSTVLRRIMQGKTPLKSTLRRGYLADAIDAPVQYWPCEEGIDAQQISSAIDANAMTFFGDGRPRFGVSSDFIGSSPLPKVNASQWVGYITPYVSTGKVQLRFLLEIPADGIPNNSSVAWLETTGTLHIWEIFYRTGGGLSLNITNNAGTLVLTGGSIALDLNGALARASLELTQNGGNVDWGLSRYDVISGVAGGSGASQAGTVGIASRMIIGPRRLTAPINDVVIGHIVIQSNITSAFELSSEYGAWRGESPIDRADRLSIENGIQPIAWFGSTSTYPMGPQAPTLLTTLIKECQDAAQGTIYESRCTGNKLVFKALNSIVAQNTKLILNYAAQQVTEPFQPSSDDKPVRNDITAKRTYGGEFRLSQETGPNNAQEPGTITGAVGRFDQQYPINCQYEAQLPDVAGWELHLGTTEAERWPKLKLNFRADSNLTYTTQAGILELDIDDRVTVRNMSAVGYYDDIDLILRGYTETFSTAYEHTIEFNCAPYDPYNVAVLDNVGSRLASEQTTLVSSLTSSATTFQITGELWTTTAGDFPMNLQINGETIRLSSITGAAIPQTCNVDAGGRSVNGVVKAHAAGSVVDIAVPVYLGR